LGDYNRKVSGKIRREKLEQVGKNLAGSTNFHLILPVLMNISVANCAICFWVLFSLLGYILNSLTEALQDQ
jgi:hypothetical protein